MKLFARSPNGKMLKFGTDVDNKWYFMTEEIEKNVGSLKIPDEVTITSETRKGSLYVTSIKSITATAPVVKASDPVKTTVTPSTVGTASTSGTTVVHKKEWVPSPQYDGGRSPDVQRSIKRQAIAHATTRALICMQGKYKDVQELGQAFEYLYDIIELKVG